MSEFVVPSASFWNFSLTLYAESGCAERCLELQNQWGLDVNLVLFCLWYGKSFGTLPHSILTDALDFSQHWRSQVVQPLRDLRVDMKQQTALASHFPFNEFEELRENIKKLELAAEQRQQEQLQRIAENSDLSECEEDAGLENLRSLCRELEIASSSKLEEHFTALCEKAAAIPV